MALILPTTIGSPVAGPLGAAALDAAALGAAALLSAELDPQAVTRIAEAAMMAHALLTLLTVRARCISSPHERGVVSAMARTLATWMMIPKICIVVKVFAQTEINLMHDLYHPINEHGKSIAVLLDAGRRLAWID